METEFSSSKVNVKEYLNEGLERERSGNNQIKMINNVLKLKKEVQIFKDPLCAEKDTF